MRSDDIAGYIYQADIVCPSCLVDLGIAQGWLSPAARDMPVEDVLDMAQHDFGVDREDETGFDSDIFPKVLLVDGVTFDAEGTCLDRCGECGEELID